MRKSKIKNKVNLPLMLAGALVLGGTIAACDSNDFGKEQMVNRINELKIGMTREQVTSMLGPVEFSTTPPGFPPDCDSWAYSIDGVTKYVHVRYRFDIPDGSIEPRTVISINDDQDDHCFIE